MVRSPMAKSARNGPTTSRAAAHGVIATGSKQTDVGPTYVAQQPASNSVAQQPPSNGTHTMPAAAPPASAAPACYAADYHNVRSTHSPAVASPLHASMPTAMGAWHAKPT